MFSLTAAGSWRYSAPVSPLKEIFDSWFSVHEMLEGTGQGSRWDCNGAAISKGDLVIYAAVHGAQSCQDAGSRAILMSAEEFWYPHLCLPVIVTLSQVLRHTHPRLHYRLLTLCPAAY